MLILIKCMVSDFDSNVRDNLVGPGPVMAPILERLG